VPFGRKIIKWPIRQALEYLRTLDDEGWRNFILILLENASHEISSDITVQLASLLEIVDPAVQQLAATALISLLRERIPDPWSGTGK
jgi:hypothetical protein